MHLKELTKISRDTIYKTSGNQELTWFDLSGNFVLVYDRKFGVVYTFSMVDFNGESWVPISSTSVGKS